MLRSITFFIFLSTTLLIYFFGFQLSAYCPFPNGKKITSNLPIIQMTTQGQKINKTHMQSVQIEIYQEPEKKDPVFQGKAGLKYRGNMSFKKPKKQYRLEFWDDKKNDLKVSLFKLPAESDFTLYAPFSDYSMLRNHIAYQFSRQNGLYAPRTRFVELYLTEENRLPQCRDYMGIFVLTEKIKIGPNRVNIATQTKKPITSPSIQGGYLLEMTRNLNDDPQLFFISKHTESFIFYDYPPARWITTAQKSYIQAFINQFEKVSYGPNFKDKKTGYNRYLDVSTAIDYLILNELFYNTEFLQHSTFMHKDIGSKLRLGPVWDLNLTMGNTIYAQSQGNYVGWVTPTRVWTERLFLDQSFSSKFINRYLEWRQKYISPDYFNQTIEKQASILKKAQKRDYQRWKSHRPTFEYNLEIAKLQKWLTNRIDWIDKNISSLPKLIHTCANYFKANKVFCFRFGRPPNNNQN